MLDQGGPLYSGTVNQGDILYCLVVKCNRGGCLTRVVCGSLYRIQWHGGTQYCKSTEVVLDHGSPWSTLLGTVARWYCIVSMQRRWVLDQGDTVQWYSGTLILYSGCDATEVVLDHSGP